ncbi:MAG TPA: molybdopterin-guanine dinucleotide biosynthesis protein B [Methanoregulaceae archaeon]|nr:molybdopterin-guanine dinucleotide biosynthesis protein B [Methanoregulaceae archaeon]
MRVVQFAGWSGTGKTTLVEGVLRVVPRGLTAGVVKHLGGEHPFGLEPGRDTTRLYTGGAAVVTGIDREKGVTLVRADSLAAALDRLSDAGCDLALVEGFKTVPFARVVVGDLPSERVVLRDPSPEEVVAALDRFDEYHSPGGLLLACRRETGVTDGVECTCRVPVGPARSTDPAHLAALEARCRAVPGVVGVKVHGRVYPEGGQILVALIARDPGAAAAALASFGSVNRGTADRGGQE